MKVYGDNALDLSILIKIESYHPEHFTTFLSYNKCYTDGIAEIVIALFLIFPQEILTDYHIKLNTIT